MRHWGKPGGLLIVGVLAAVLPVEAQWLRWTTGGLPDDHGVPLTVATHPQDSNIVYVGTRSAGVYASRDGGETWASLGRGLEESTVFVLLVHPDDPSLIYAGTQVGQYQTLGPEPAWTRPFYADVSITWDLALSAETPRRLYAALPRIGFHHHIEGTQLGDFHFGEEAGAVAIALDPASASSVEIALGPSLFRLEGRGTSWCRIDRFASRVLDVLLLPGGSRLVATTDGVFRHVRLDGPRRQVFDLPAWTLEISPHDPTKVLLGLASGAGSHPGLWMSVDAGATWSPSAKGLPEARAILSIAFDPKRPRRVWAVVFDEGVYSSADGGKTWERRWSGPSLTPQDKGIP